jgi:hypothetical protein
LGRARDEALIHLRSGGDTRLGGWPSATPAEDRIIIMQLYRLVGGLSLGLLGSIALACGDGEGDGDGGSGSCVPGQQVACACPDGGDGVQVCSPEGDFFGACSCGDATGGESETEGDTEVESASGDGTTGADTCGNGMEDPGECPLACPEDCTAVDDTMGDSSSTGSDSCADQPIYVANVPMQPSRWESGALIGFAAGQELCRQAAMAVGAPEPMDVTVCDYEQVVMAEAAGEFAALPAGSNAWIHRTTAAPVMAVNSAPGTGGRCVDWTYTTNHISDGEYAEFAGGVATYFLDNDTFYDGVDTTHAQAGTLQCGTAMRAILCCNPLCEPEG